MKLLLVVTAVLLLNSHGSCFDSPVLVFPASLSVCTRCCRPGSLFLFYFSDCFSSHACSAFPSSLCLPSCVIVCSCARFPAASHCVISPMWSRFCSVCLFVHSSLLFSSCLFHWVSVSCSLNKCINYSELAFNLDRDCFILMHLFENVITVQTLLQGSNCVL